MAHVHEESEINTSLVELAASASNAMFVGNRIEEELKNPAGSDIVYRHDRE
eukprot:m.846401 g.846401  ORF g.846401 m.846401 type:complete len:51 (+) comp23477_c1_seq96:6162-6314(+)